VDLAISAQACAESETYGIRINSGAPKGTILELFSTSLCQVCHSLKSRWGVFRPMSVHDGSRSDQDEGFLPAGPAGSQRNPEQLVKGRELMARSLHVQNQQLLTKGQIFKDEVLAGPEKR
jgi:hypothetical protein